MKLTIEGTPKEIQKTLQAICGSKKRLINGSSRAIFPGLSFGKPVSRKEYIKHYEEYLSRSSGQ